MNPINTRPNIYFKLILLSFFLLTSNTLLAVTTCDNKKITLQVLGSGGPEITDNRASSGYLIWINNQAKLLIDLGGGSMQRFESSGANLNDLDAVLLTHLHVDHSADLPVLIKGSYFTGRQNDLQIFGPTENQLMPSLTEFIEHLFSPQGAYRYLSDYLDGSEDYRIIAKNISAKGTEIKTLLKHPDYTISSVPVIHGPIPAIAWRIDIDDTSIVFSGDMNGSNHTLEKLAVDADMLVAHNAIPENAGRIARNLHMPPSVIGEIAAKAKIKTLILSHRMNRTLGKEEQTLSIIKKHFSGPVYFANDLDCFSLK